MKPLSQIAAEWHSGQHSALYSYASTGTIWPGITDEIRECYANLLPSHERHELERLHCATAPALTKSIVSAYSVFWHRFLRNADGSPVRCRKTGQMKTWKRDPFAFRMPVKYGLKESFYLDPNTIGEWCLPIDTSARELPLETPAPTHEF